MTQAIRRRWFGVGLAGCLALAVWGQYLLARQRPAFADGVVLYAISAVLFLVLNGIADRAGIGLALPSFEAREGPAHPPVWPRPARIGLVAASLLCAGGALRVIISRPPAYWGAFYLWLASIVLFVAAQVHRPSFAGWAEWKRRAYANRWEIAAVALMLVGGALLRGVNLAGVPANVGGDEGSQGLEAIDFLTGAKTNMFETGWLGVPTMSFLWQALWFKVFGISVTTLRLPWAFVGTVTLLVFYLLVRRLLGKRLALISTFFLTTYHYHIHYSRLGSNQVADALFMALVLYFLTRGLSTRQPLDFALAGVSLGASIYFYAGARLTFVVVAAYLVVVGLLDERKLRGQASNLMILVGAAFVVALPLGYFYYKHPDDFNARLNMVGIIQSGWLEREVQITGRPAIRILADQFQRAFFAFNYYHDRTVWYGATIPLMDFASSIFFLLGLVLATFRWRRDGYLPFLVWFWLGLILGGMMTESPPSSQRLITLAPSASLFASLALTRTWDMLGAAMGKARAWSDRFIVISLVCLALIGTVYYFHRLMPKRLYGSLNGEVATEMGYYLRDLGPDYRCYFFGPGRMYYGFSTIPFIARGVEGLDVSQPISGPPDFVLPDKGAVFVFLPERLWEWNFVKQKYPGGTIRDFAHARSQDLLFTAYVVPRNIVQAASGP
ncbi:MAG: hypothetical protein Kow00123_12510 [Anaerolineales bacterium]